MNKKSNRISKISKLNFFPVHLERFQYKNKKGFFKSSSSRERKNNIILIDFESLPSNEANNKIFLKKIPGSSKSMIYQTIKSSA